LGGTRNSMGTRSNLRQSSWNLEHKEVSAYDRDFITIHDADDPDCGVLPHIAQRLLGGGSKHERISAIVGELERGNVYERDWVLISCSNGWVGE